MNVTLFDELLKAILTPDEYIIWTGRPVYKDCMILNLGIAVFVFGVCTFIVFFSENTKPISSLLPFLHIYTIIFQITASILTFIIFCIVHFSITNLAYVITNKKVYIVNRFLFLSHVLDISLKDIKQIKITNTFVGRKSGTNSGTILIYESDWCNSIPMLNSTPYKFTFIVNPSEVVKILNEAKATPFIMN